jgi:hypothetical protein
MSLNSSTNIHSVVGITYERREHRVGTGDEFHTLELRFVNKDGVVTECVAYSKRGWRAGSHGMNDNTDEPGAVAIAITI